MVVWKHQDLVGIPGPMQCEAGSKLGIRRVSITTPLPLLSSIMGKRKRLKRILSILNTLLYFLQLVDRDELKPHVWIHSVLRWPPSPRAWMQASLQSWESIRMDGNDQFKGEDKLLWKTCRRISEIGCWSWPRRSNLCPWRQFLTENEQTKNTLHRSHQHYPLSQVRDSWESTMSSSLVKKSQHIWNDDDYHRDRINTVLAVNMLQNFLAFNTFIQSEKWDGEWTRCMCFGLWE